eukprot:1303789-Lingulodinium_polyedra.AAC.1
MGTICTGLNALLADEADVATRQGADGVAGARPPPASGLCTKEAKVLPLSPPLPPPSRPASCV